jgi:glycosyltransferase involved in cell wall biosynthesis
MGSAELDIRIFPASPPRRIAFSSGLARALKEDVARYDVIHVHSLYLYPQFAAYRAALREGVPYVVSVHGMLDPWLRQQGRTQKVLADYLWQSSMLASASRLVFGADREASLARDIAADAPRVVVPLPIDWRSFGGLPSPDDFRHNRLGGFGGKLILFMGRLTPKKRVDLLIEAFSRLARERSDCMLAIAGPDQAGMQAHLQQIAVKEGIADRVAFLGMLRGAEKLAALAATDIWVLPSHSEGGSVAFTEALASGLATIAPDAVAIAADAAAEHASMTCELSVESLAEAIGTLLDDDDLRTRLGATARIYARRFDREVIASTLAEVYAGVAVGAGSGPNASAGGFCDAALERTLEKGRSR